MEERMSIYAYIYDALGDNECLPDDFNLPSEEIEGLTFADGAMDGISIYHMGNPELSDEDRDKLYEILKLLGQDNEELFDAEDAITDFCKEHRVIGIIDDILDGVLAHQRELAPGIIKKNAERLTLEAESKECVKFGMVLLELFKPDDITETIANVLGRSDEFTVFSIFLLRHFEDGQKQILELARNVKGWGRIHCVDYILPETDEIKEWLLFNGVDNYVMPAYSAHVVYEKAEVEKLIEKDDLSKEELAAILKTVSGMLDEGPVKGISLLDDPEDFLVKVLTKSCELMPLSPAEYEIINEIDEWQEETGEDDNPDLDYYVNEIFADSEAKKTLDEIYARRKAMEDRETLASDENDDEDADGAMDITEELVYLGMTTAEAEKKGVKACISEELPNCNDIYYKLDTIPDELCISKVLGWEKKITIEKKSLEKVFDFLYPDGYDYDYKTVTNMIDGDIVVLYGYGD